MGTSHLREPFSHGGATKPAAKPSTSASAATPEATKSSTPTTSKPAPAALS